MNGHSLKARLRTGQISTGNGERATLGCAALFSAAIRTLFHYRLYSRCGTYADFFFGKQNSITRPSTSPELRRVLFGKSFGM
jgi:hypothetical protein